MINFEIHLTKRNCYEYYPPPPPFFLALILGFSGSVAAVDVQSVCQDIEHRFRADTNAFDVSPALTYKRAINTGGPIYAAIGRETQIRGRKTNFCYVSEIADLAKCLYDYSFSNSNRYAWWEVDGASGNQFLGGFSSNRNHLYNPTRRGEKAVVLVQTDKYHTTNPHQHVGNPDLKIPVCDAIKVYSHNLPVASASAVQGGRNITAQANPQIDSLSERGRSGANPIVRWRLSHERYHEATYTVTGTNSLNFRPEYNGIYSIYLSVNDGNFTTTRRVGDVHFSGGEERCWECDQVIIQ